MSTSDLRRALRNAVTATGVAAIVALLLSPANPAMSSMPVHPAWVIALVLAARYGARGLYAVPAVILGVQLAARLALVYAVYFKPSLKSYCSGVDTTITLLQFILLLTGMFWLFHSHCRTADPVVWKLCFCLFIILAVIVCLPVILLCLCLPLAWACTPCLHRILGVWLNKRRGADESVLAGLSSEVYADGRFPKDDSACAICAESYVAGQPIRVLPCPSHMHHFHLECIDKWLRVNASCPICRFRLVAERNDNEDDLPAAI